MSSRHAIYYYLSHADSKNGGVWPLDRVDPNLLTPVEGGALRRSSSKKLSKTAQRRRRSNLCGIMPRSDE